MAATVLITDIIMGAAADRPTGKVGQMYVATDTGVISVCTSAGNWV